MICFHGRVKTKIRRTGIIVSMGGKPTLNSFPTAVAFLGLFDGEEDRIKLFEAAGLSTKEREYLTKALETGLGARGLAPEVGRTHQAVSYGLPHALAKIERVADVVRVAKEREG